MALRSATPGGGTSGGFSAPPTATPAASVTATALTIPVKLPNGQIVNVGTQAEVDALRAAVQPTQIVDLSKPAGTSSGGMSTAADFLDIGADALKAVGGFLAGSKYGRLLQDLQNARYDLMDARDALARSTSDPATVNPMLAALDSLISYQDASIAVLNAQITAVDMSAGGDTAKIISKFIEGGGLGSGNGGGMGTGTALALGAGGIGLGLLVSSSNNNSNSSSRRR